MAYFLGTKSRTNFLIYIEEFIYRYFSNKNMVRTLIKWILAMVIAMLIFSCIVSPITRYQVKEFFSDIKDKITTTVQKVPTPQKLSCEEKAKGLIPKTFTLEFQEGMMSIQEGWVFEDFNPKWNDGTNIDISDKYKYVFSRGSGVGENVNLFYLRDESLGYSKQIVSDEGLVLGITSFQITAIVKPIQDTERYTPRMWWWSWESEKFSDEENSQITQEDLNDLCISLANREEVVEPIVHKWGDYQKYCDVAQDFEIIDVEFVSCEWIEE